MEENKLMHKNQVLENCERDFQISNGIPRNVSNTLKVYGRDLLLQLRLHPLSLQKPKVLPEMEMIKEKLYLHDITKNKSPPNDKLTDSSRYHASLKPDYCAAKQDYQIPHYVSRMYPYYYAPHVHEGAYSSSSKYRSSLHTYCSPLKKPSVASHCYKDFPADEYAYAKRCFATSEDMWNCYQNFSKKKENVEAEAVPKSRKKLPIIDPVTGKNVLETVIHQEQLSDADAVDKLPENSELSNNIAADGIDGENFSGGYPFNGEINNDLALHLTNNTCTGDISSSVNKTCEDKTKYPKGIGEADCLYKGSDSNHTSEDTQSNYKSAQAARNKENLHIDTKTKTAYTYDDIQMMQQLANELHEQNMHINCDTSKGLCKNMNITTQNRETNHSDMPNTCQTQQNLTVENGTVNPQQLKDKFFTLREEQQKMLILHSFLRYKKFQLEETARNLDEKRIEIANWECSLINKAKRLREKELWLENKSEILYKKAIQLVEKEELLKKEESKSSGDGASSAAFKQSDISAKKAAFDISVDATWNEMAKNAEGSSKNGKSDDYKYFSYTSVNNVGADTSSCFEKCKSDACSLDELEKNIVLIEKMHSSSEGGDKADEKRGELASSNTMQKISENNSLGYSKGRRYLPEHIKYWLGKRDKSAL